jgi:hypothetical protein
MQVDGKTVTGWREETTSLDKEQVLADTEFTEWIKKMEIQGNKAHEWNLTIGKFQNEKEEL